MNESGPPSAVEALACGDGFPVAEDHLTSLLGVPRRLLREARNSSSRGTDWASAGKRVFWSQEAADRFVAQLTPMTTIERQAEAKIAPVPPPELNGNGHIAIGHPEVLRVVAWNFPNRRVIHCVLDNGNTSSERVAVRVKDAQLFRNGMRVLARPAVGSAWQFEGNPDNPSAGPRGPRWPGKW